ncbi:MAG: hypothetical protein FWG18_00200 [Alphaproteobacteria bacterium]|nr:hypothetical protein [Alphaproteobacteria bacterium]
MNAFFIANKFKKNILQLSIVNCYLLIVISAFADDCVMHKMAPAVSITVPEWRMSVVQPDAPMDLLHGNIEASLIESYSIQAMTVPVADGYCVVLHALSAEIGYTEFLVQIDARHIPNSCEYNVTLEHEREHITAHLSTINDSSNAIQTAVRRAANSIMPIFVRGAHEVDSALDSMEQELQTHPDIILMKQQINAEQEIRNKKVDQREDGQRLNKLCGIDYLRK